MPRYLVEVERIRKTTAVVAVEAGDGDQAIADVESRLDEIAIADNTTDEIRVVKAEPIVDD